MRILAIETSGTGGSAAVSDGPRLLAEQTLSGQRRSTQTLAPTIHSLLGAAHWKPADVQLIGVTIGPGSFTGLRLGIATAKMLAYVTGAAVVGVDTLRAIAAQATSPIDTITSVLDAGRGEVLVGHFGFDTAGVPLAVGETKLLAAMQWLTELAPNAHLTGNGLRTYLDQLPNGVRFEPEANWEPRATTVARLALHDYNTGRRDDLWTLAPIYYRRSAAEEVWERKQR